MPFPQNGNYYGKQKGEKTFADFVENDLTNDEMQQNVEKQQLWKKLNDYEIPVYAVYYLEGTKEKKLRKLLIVAIRLRRKRMFLW